MGVELRHLNHLIAAIEKGTIGKAAESLGISQPALTKSIRNLEAMLQVRLLERRSRGVVPTVYGELVVSRGRSVKIELQEIVYDIQALRAGTGTHVRIGVAQGVASRLVPAAMIRLSTERPKSRFSVWAAAAGELIKLLTDGDIEFAVAPLGGYDPQARLAEEVLFEDRPVIVVARNHPLAHKAFVRPKDLVKARWVLPQGTTPLRRMLDRIFISENVRPPAPTIECDSAVYVKSVLMEKDFVGFLPRDEITVEEKSRLLRGIAFKTNTPGRPIGILRRRSGALSPSSMLLVKQIKRMCDELGYGAPTRQVGSSK
jgi:DNA-binding transcriptional LysR family regulator